MSRKTAREELFKLLFEADLKGVKPLEIVNDYLIREDVKELRLDRQFLEKYATEISENYEMINEMIDSRMEKWSLATIGSVERVLLRFAGYELYKNETPNEIVINEAIELAKKYGDEKSHEFINGVLAKLVK